MLPRAQTSSEPERHSGGEGDTREEVGGEFVVAGVDAAEVLEAAEGVLDEVSEGRELHEIQVSVVGVLAPPRIQPDFGKSIRSIARKRKIV